MNRRILLAGVALWLAACGSSDDGDDEPDGASGGAAAAGGQASSGGENAGGTGAGGASQGGTPGAGGAATGSFPVSAVDDCRYGGTEISGCAGTERPRQWECDTNPSETPPADDCAHPTDDNPGDVHWCCTDPFCTRFPGGDGTCTMISASQAHGYICPPDTPGLDACVAFAGGLYCCP